MRLQRPELCKRSNDPTLLSVTDAATKIGVNPQHRLFRQIATGAVRSHEGKVRLSESFEPIARRISISRRSRRRRRRHRSNSRRCAVACDCQSHRKAPSDATAAPDDETTRTMRRPSWSTAGQWPTPTPALLKETYLARLKAKLDDAQANAVASPLWRRGTASQRVFGLSASACSPSPEKLSARLTASTSNSCATRSTTPWRS